MKIFNRAKLVPLLTLALTIVACAHLAVAPVSKQTTADAAELWAEPTDIGHLDLLAGPGGHEGAPKPDERFEFIARDSTGYSHGWEVKDSKGEKWHVKLGLEAQPEIVVSRLAWAIGFHQPPTYYLPKWTMVIADRETHQGAGRFRPEIHESKKLGAWRWRQNPFVGSEPLHGLFVLMAMVENWDLKDSNNVVYEFTKDRDGVQRWYVIKDLGASLGYHGGSPFPGSRNNIDDFEKHGFIKSVEGQQVLLDFHPARQQSHPVDSVSRSDVFWVARRLSQLSDQQWQDTFKAAGYDTATADRFIAHLKTKVQQGLSLGEPSR